MRFRCSCTTLSAPSTLSSNEELSLPVHAPRQRFKGVCGATQGRMRSAPHRLTRSGVPDTSTVRGGSYG